MDKSSSWIKITAIGRPFEVGSLYNYHEDVIISSNSSRIRKGNRSATTNTKTKEKKEISVNVHPILSNIEDEEDCRNWFSNLQIDDHTAISLSTKLVTPLPATTALGYLNDCLYGHQRPGICVQYRNTIQKVITNVSQQELQRSCRANNDATHIVVAVSYGLDAFCLFRSTCDSASIDEVRNFAQEFSEFLVKDKMTTPQSSIDGDGISSMIVPDANHQCAFYGDIGENKIEISPLEMYENCCKILDDRYSSKAVPLYVWLSPLIQKNNGSLPAVAIFPDFSNGLVTRCQAIFLKLQSINIALDDSLQKDEFIESIQKKVDEFLIEFRKFLAKLTISFRKGGIEEMIIEELIDRVENFSPFNAQRLKDSLDQHLKRKQELEKIRISSGVGLIKRGSELPLLEEFKHFTVVIHQPDLEHETIRQMVNYIDTINIYNSRTIRIPLPWPDKKETATYSWSDFRKTVDSTRDFITWVKNFGNQEVEYWIKLKDRNDKQYHSGTIEFYDHQLARNSSPGVPYSIPKPPFQLHVTENRRGSVSLAWSVEKSHPQFDHFVLQYRGSMVEVESCWTTTKALKLSHRLDNLRSGGSYVFRVQLATAGGKSPFSQISLPFIVDPINPAPNEIVCYRVGHNCADIAWRAPINPSVPVKLYLIDFWMDQQELPIQRSTTETHITLEPLLNNTTYQIQVRAEMMDRSTSPASAVISITTKREGERLAHIICRKSTLMSGGTDNSAETIKVYRFPLDKHEQQENRFMFWRPSYLSIFGKTRQRTILMLGATGSGKSTIINGMINYLLGVNWEDDFRFKLIDESFNNKSQAHSQTQCINTYDIYRTDEMNMVNYDLTLVDTPGFGDTSGLEKDNYIKDQIKIYFENNISHLEAVCFVVQAPMARLTDTQKYIFDSILSIFDKDIKENIRFMITFADNQPPQVLEAIKTAGIPSPVDSKTSDPLYYKFNFAELFSEKKGSKRAGDNFSRMIFKMNIDNFNRFFEDLEKLETKSLSGARQVMDERKQLDVLVEGLHKKMQKKLIKVAEFDEIKKKLTENQESVEANKDFEFEVDYLVPKAVDISGTGKYTTNCQTCNTTCHYPCKHASDNDKYMCLVMNQYGICTYCNHSWSVHYNQKYRYVMVKETIKRSSDALKRQYQNAQKEEITNAELLRKLQDEITKGEKEILEVIELAMPSIRKLNQMALKPHLISTPQYIDVIIESEKTTHADGYMQRISTLQTLRKMAELTTTLVEKEKTLELDTSVGS